MNLFDAKECADEFMRLFGENKEAIDHSLMIGWFANTIMAGWDEGRRRLEADHQAELDRVMGVLNSLLHVDDSDSRKLIIESVKA